MYLFLTVCDFIHREEVQAEAILIHTGVMPEGKISICLCFVKMLVVGI